MLVNSEEQGVLLTKAYIEDNDLGYIVYVDTRAQWLREKWLEIDGQFRYVDGIGKVRSRYGGCATGGYYGDFDEFWLLDTAQ